MSDNGNKCLTPSIADEAIPQDDFVRQHYNQSRLYEFEEENKSNSADEKKSIADALEQRRNTKVCLKNLPKDLKENGLRNLCNQYGQVKYMLYWSVRNYAFVTYASLSEAENAIRKINSSNTLGIKADFAFDSRQKENGSEIVDAVLRAEQPERYDTEINWDEREIRGPFNHPTRVPDELIKVKRCATEKDYENNALSKADPFKEFLDQYRNDEVAEFVELKRRIVNGRSILIKNEKLLEIIMEKSKSSSGHHDKGTYSFRNRILPDPFEFISSCSKCKEPSNQYCRNCDAPFCSMLCEATDDIHKQICANDEMVEITSAVEPKQEDEAVIEMTTKWIDKSNVKVKLTSIVDFRTVYVRPSNPHDDMEFIRLMNDVAGAAKTSKRVMAPMCGLMVLAPFETIYQRALILKLLDQDAAVVAFIDFGNVDTVAVTDMRIMSAELKKRSRMVARFRLRHVPDAMCNEIVLQVLFELMNKSAEVTLRFDEPYEPGVSECELITSAFDSVNQAIIKANVPHYDESDANVPYTIMPFANIAGRDVPCLILDNLTLNLGSISVIRSADADLFHRNHQRIQTVASHLEHEGHITPGRLQYCLAKDTDDQWYRVQAIEVKFDGHVAVLFIDYGSINILKIYRFRKMPTALMFPCITATVACFDTNEATLEIEAKRKKLLPIMGDVIFMGLTANDIADGEYHGDCVGTLAPEIYSQIDERETQT